MKCKGSNHPFVVWAACFLWLTSLFAITWSLLLFICIGDILLLTGTDLVNALVLLSGIIMLPTNFCMLCSIANNKKIDPKAKVVCCPLWLCIVWIIIVNCVGAALCLQRIYKCKETTSNHISKSMKYYRSVPKHKHFIDNLQWSLKCCGLNSYKDWFSRDWYDKIRDYEWDPAANKPNTVKQKETTIADSVPLRFDKIYATVEWLPKDSRPLSTYRARMNPSFITMIIVMIIGKPTRVLHCCKSGSCISNYLMELGTNSINTNGCGQLMHRIIMTSMNGHLIMFLSVVLVEILILNYIIRKDNHKESDTEQTAGVNVCHLMSVNDNFDDSSGSYQLNPEDDDSDVDEVNLALVNNAKVDLAKVEGDVEEVIEE